MPKITKPAWADQADPDHPVLGTGNGPYRYSILGETGGLSQFGAHLEELQPGSRSSYRHWHACEDEMIYVLNGEVVLIEDSETVLTPGDITCWPAGAPIGHCLENRSGQPATYLTVGTRTPDDVIHYPDNDLITQKTGDLRRYTHADGRERRICA